MIRRTIPVLFLALILICEAWAANTATSLSESTNATNSTAGYVEAGDFSVFVSLSSLCDGYVALQRADYNKDYGRSSLVAGDWQDVEVYYASTTRQLTEGAGAWYRLQYGNGTAGNATARVRW